MKLPDSLETNNPKEAIGFAVAYGIEEGILPKDFKMSDIGYRVLEAAIIRIWESGEERVNEVMISFIAGYATGSKQVTYKG